MNTQQRYPPARDDELAEGFGFLRSDERFRRLMPEKKALKVDWFLLRAIDREITKRRAPRSKLALLTGTVVREFIPDVNKKTRELGNAYKCAMMHIFRRRQEFQKRLKSGVKATESPTDRPEQYRMI